MDGKVPKGGKEWKVQVEERNNREGMEGTEKRMVREE